MSSAPFSSDYGILDPEACDPKLRSRVLEALKPSTAGAALSGAQLQDVAQYITQLEDALVRHHWGSIAPAQILELVRCATGLDIESRVLEFSEMTAVDA